MLFGWRILDRDVVVNHRRLLIGHKRFDVFDGVRFVCGRVLIWTTVISTTKWIGQTTRYFAFSSVGRRRRSDCAQLLIGLFIFRVGVFVV